MSEKMGKGQLETMQRQSTAKEIRVQKKVSLSRAYAIARVKSGYSHECVAAHCGVSHTKSRQWADESNLNAVPSVADIAMMPEEICSELRRWVDHEMAPEPGGQSDQNARVDAIVQTQAQVISRVLDALDDGKITPEEAEMIAPVALALRDRSEDLYRSMVRKSARGESEANVIGIAKVRGGSKEETA